MAHEQQRDFCLMVRARFPQYFTGVWALDIGSLNINGSNRSLFEGSGYLGVDLGVGSNVDFIVPGHKLGMPDESFDTVVSTECFEHDPHYAKTLQNAVRMLKPGGLFLFTCATEGRPEHGTRRTSPGDAPLQQSLEEWQDHYKNLTAADIQACIDVNGIFASHEFSTNLVTQDLYFWGIKKGKLAKHTMYSFFEDHEKLAAQRQQITALKAQLNEGLPGALADRERLGLAQKRMRELNVLTREMANDRKFWQARSEELERMVADLKGQLAWYENTRSWKVTKPLRFVTRMKSEGVISPVRSYLAKRLGRGQAEVPPAPAVVAPTEAPPLAVSTERLVFDHRNIRVMTTRHTRFVATLISDTLTRLGYHVSIDSEFIEASDTGYVVICPQMFERMPPRYAAFQMEQSVNSRWFTPRYFELLKGAEVVFDYATENVEFLAGKGLPFWQLFYVPITPRQPNDVLESKLDETSRRGPKTEDVGSEPEQVDFAFYGDPNAPRRQEMIATLSRHFKVVVLSEVFGEELTARLKAARAIVNIHYYENALLETTRLSEAISMGFPVLSEGVANKETEAQFASREVTFFKNGDANDMLEQARRLLERLDRERPTDAEVAPPPPAPSFSDYFERYLIYRGHLPSSAMSGRFFPAPSRRQPYPRVTLSLPETPARQRAFANANTYGFRIIQGARGGPGWVGCGLSYKFMAREALTGDARYLTICEDDVVFGADFNHKFETIERWLQSHDGQWDVFSGLIADVHEDAVVSGFQDLGEVKLVTINRMTSTVFNVYSRRALELMSRWDEHDRDAETNTIDRYLERTANLRVVVAVPYLVGHSEELTSTLWGFQNTQYTSMIQRSEARLQQKVDSFLARGVAKPGTPSQPSTT
jgi:SAM-dependent methyltransferase